MRRGCMLLVECGELMNGRSIVRQHRVWISRDGTVEACDHGPVHTTLMTLAGPGALPDCLYVAYRLRQEPHTAAVLQQPIWRGHTFAMTHEPRVYPILVMVQADRAWSLVGSVFGTVWVGIGLLGCLVVAYWVIQWLGGQP
jgi:hypothetical protein